MGYFAQFSGLPPATPTNIWFPHDSHGCGAYDVSAADRELGGQPVVAVVDAWNCSFLEKAVRAQAAGAAGVVIASSNETIWLMAAGNDSRASDIHIFAVSVPGSLRDALSNARRGNASALVSFSDYVFDFWDPAEVCMMVLATSLVVLGAFFSTADANQDSPLAQALAPNHEEVHQVDSGSSFSFCVMGSVMLLVLFFFMRYMIIGIIGVFCFGGFLTILEITSIGLEHCRPSLMKEVKVPGCGLVPRSAFIAGPPAAAIVMSFIWFRNAPIGFIPQDIMGAGFLCSIQRTLRLPNIQTATILLSVMFCFDVFWVFVSPLLFAGKSVMIEVATGSQTGEMVPMLLRIPCINDALGCTEMLGFGDIALPGLLISYLLRHDMKGNRSWAKGYFVPAVIGYFCGLVATNVALYEMQFGQPALFYLVPGTLGTTLLLGACRGELKNLWDGKVTDGKATDGRLPLLLTVAE